MALVLSLEAPLETWLAELDAQVQRSPAVFVGRPVVLDFSALPRTEPDLQALFRDLQTHGMRVVAVEGADPSWPGIEAWQRTPMMNASRSGRVIELPDEPAKTSAAEPEATSLMLDGAVRSGQSVVFEKGDVTVIGSVASGAEIVAGGSIHVYGTLRGRAVAGVTGNAQARIFCRRLEAELIAIDGFYKTADDMESGLRGRAVQAWLGGEALIMAALD
jgi:septum site-determining protein MinC